MKKNKVEDTESANKQEPLDEARLKIKRELQVNELSKETKNNFLSRTIIGICLVIVVLPCLLLGGYFILGLVLFLAIIMTHEIVKAPQSLEHKFNNIVFVFSYIMMFLMVCRGIFKSFIGFYLDNNTLPTLNYLLSTFHPELSLTCFCISMAFFYLEALFDKKFKLTDAFYFICMLFLVSLGLQSIIYLRSVTFSNNLELMNDSSFKYFFSGLLLLMVFAETCLNDVFAYLSGVLFGKHKMCPSISPKKTWEGFIGGVFLSFALCFTVCMVLAYFDIPLLEGILDFDRWYNILIICLVIPFVGTFGDLFFSKIKREFAIKDFGTILKSHGGILDRFDSLLFTSIVVALLVLLMCNSWKIFG